MTTHKLTIYVSPDEKTFRFAGEHGARFTPTHTTRLVPFFEPSKEIFVNDTELELSGFRKESLTVLA